MGVRAANLDVEATPSAAGGKIWPGEAWPLRAAAAHGAFGFYALDNSGMAILSKTCNAEQRKQKTSRRKQNSVNPCGYAIADSSHYGHKPPIEKTGEEFESAISAICTRRANLHSLRFDHRQDIFALRN